MSQQGMNGAQNGQHAGLRSLLAAMTLGLSASVGFGWTSAGEDSLTAATYNVRVAVMDAAIDDWVDNRRHLVMQSITARQPDFMGFQEAYARRVGSAGISQQTALGQLFSGTKWEYLSWEATNEFNMNPIIVNTDRFAIVDSGVHEINFIDFLGISGWNEFHDLHTFFHGSGGSAHFLGPERYNTWVVANDLLTGERVAFLNCHYETFIGSNHHGPEFDDLFVHFAAIVNSAFGYASREIVAHGDFLQATLGDLAVIIAGDFETPDPLLPSQKEYTDAGYSETWRYINGSGQRPTMGIDNLFAKLTSFVIEGSTYDTAGYTSGASDHKPLYGELTQIPCPAPVNYCVAAPNSVGLGALMSWSGSTDVSAGTGTLHASALPPLQSGLFFYGSTQVQHAVGNGFICAGGGLQRLPVVHVDAGGRASHLIDIGSLPSSGTIVSGSIWNFQFWYRDPAAGGAFFNFSDGLQVTFCND